jgi:uncharacterized protein (DUF433 family)
MMTDRIEINPAIMLGKPVIRGTRIPVEIIIRKLSEDTTETDLLDAYPRLSRADLQAALAYAADSLAMLVGNESSAIGVEALAGNFPRTG